MRLKKKIKRKVIHSYINKSQLGLEIGPSHSPIAPKKDGYNVEIIDHATADQLVEKYQKLGVKTDRIEEVDYVWRGEKYVELIGEKERYEWIIASHVVEHTPDLVSFLNGCEDVLRDSGLLILAVPDYRLCFDQFRPVTGLAQVLDAHHYSRQIHTPGAVLECFINQSKKNGSFTWKKNTITRDNKLFNSIETSINLYNSAKNSSEYIDIHNWCFTPSSFELIIHDLQMLSLTKLRTVEIHQNKTFEFVVVLKKEMAPVKTQEMRLELLEKVQEELRHAPCRKGLRGRLKRLWKSITHSV